MVETEIKLAIDDISAFTRKLTLFGLVNDNPRDEINVLFDTKEDALAAKGEILRLRTFDSFKTTCILTHKGKNTGVDHLKRVENESVVDSNIFEILFALGYNEVFRYKRDRLVYHYQNPKLGGEVAIDFITSVSVKGQSITSKPMRDIYAELEGWDNWIDDLAGKLGFTKDQYIKKSYREIFS